MVWVKMVSDGSVEVGSDKNIDAGKVSWTRGRQDISQVFLTDDIKKHSIALVLDNHNTEWWQFDRFEAQIQEGVCSSKKIAIVVQGKIIKEMVGFNLCSESTNLKDVLLTNVFLEDPSSILSYNKNVLRTITNDQIGKWITVVLPRGALPRILVTDKGKY